MKIIQHPDDKLVVELEGLLDSQSAEKTAREIIPELDGFTQLELNLAQLEYVSSAGLRTILMCQKAMLAKGGSMLVSHVNEDVMDIFECTGFTDILTIQ